MMPKPLFEVIVDVPVEVTVPLIFQVCQVALPLFEVNVPPFNVMLFNGLLDSPDAVTMPPLTMIVGTVMTLCAPKRPATPKSSVPPLPTVIVRALLEDPKALAAVPTSVPPLTLIGPVNPLSFTFSVTDPA